MRAHLLRSFLEELRALAAMEYVRLVHLQGYAIDESPGTVHPFALVYIYELLKGGSLAEWLKGVGGEPPVRLRLADGAEPLAEPAGGAGHAGRAARCSSTALQRIAAAALGAAAPGGAEAAVDVWPEPAAACLSQTNVDCIRFIAGRRLTSVSDVIMRLRAVREALAPAAPVILF